MANIPANATAIPLIQGQSITGSFAGFIVCPNTSTAPQATVAHFKGLKDANNRELATSGSSPSLYFSPGYYPIFVTSASLDATSNNVLFFT
jgi:hypothetical protein